MRNIIERLCGVRTRIMQNLDDDNDSARYLSLGVSSGKGAVRRAIAGLSPGLLPSAFSKVVPDIFSKGTNYCIASHADGAGTKSLLAYLHYLIHRDPDVFRGIAQDAIVMNLDDLLCIGATTGFAVVSIINRNAKRIDEEILRSLIEGSSDFIERMNRWGVAMVHCGGETADVGDIVRTLLVDSVLTVRIRRREAISNDIRSGCMIVALASGGAPAAYEDKWNSGIGSNGLTFARHELLNSSVTERFPELADESDIPYRGPYSPDEAVPGTQVTVLEALLSPSRTFAPVVAAVLSSHRPSIHGLVHCSGGGQVKCLRFGRHVIYRKDLRNIPLLFRAIKNASRASWRELSQVFNLGYRMEVYCDPPVADDIVRIASQLGVDSAIVGHTESSDGPANKLFLTVEGESFSFSGRPWREDV